MATATKALSTLRNEGLVRAVPGVGTVVEGGNHPARTRRPAAPVGQRATSGTMRGSERIVTAAIEVADAEGLAGLSMRRVAAQAGWRPRRCTVT